MGGDRPGRPGEPATTDTGCVLFHGDQSKGTWRLFAYDDAGGTSGLIDCWALGVNYKAFEERLEHDPEQEFSTAIVQIELIGLLRLKDRLPSLADVFSGLA